MNLEALGTAIGWTGGFMYLLDLAGRTIGRARRIRNYERLAKAGPRVPRPADGSPADDGESFLGLPKPHHHERTCTVCGQTETVTWYSMPGCQGPELAEPAAPPPLSRVRPPK